MAENGVKGRAPYSVDTPYGFQIDLDFLKYVDDIEKGNTIKRVPFQRRGKGPRASTLPRTLNLSESGYRPSPWGSTGALGPQPLLSNSHHHGCASRAYNHRLPFPQPGKVNPLADMEARIKEFDEQPLGEHIRPHLLRASSLPLTVLLRQESESTDDRSSIQSSRDHLEGRNTSCEDFFLSPASPRSQDCSGLLRRLTEALERVGELEMEVRVVPELRAQICILQEERERLRLGLVHHIPLSTTNGTGHPVFSSQRTKVNVKRQEMGSRHSSRTEDDLNPTRNWKSSTDLDELLTVTSLQAKVAALEQKLHETELDHKRLVGLLMEQQQEGSRRDKNIDYLVRNPGVWVRAERVMVDQDGDETSVRSAESGTKGASFICERYAVNNPQRDGQESSAADAAEGGDTPLIIHHVKKIKSLLHEQFEVLCGERREQGKVLKHPDPKVNRLQQEMMELVDILMSKYTHDDDNGAHTFTPKMAGSTQKTEKLPSSDLNERFENAMKNPVLRADIEKRNGHSDLERGESGLMPGGMDPPQLDPNPAKSGAKPERCTGPKGQLTAAGTVSGQADGQAFLEAKAQNQTSKTKSPVEQTEGRLRDTVGAEFLSACRFVKDHLDSVGNPDNDMRAALVTLFESWFSAAAEEDSNAGTVAAHLKQVKMMSPSLLAFLINLADDNGNTVLHYSVSHCNYNIVVLLLDTGVSEVNAQNKAGYTAVMLASLTAPEGPGGMEVVRKLMELGDVNICSSQTGQTALHLAVRHGRVVMVRLLLSCGADSNIQDNQGMTALMFAAERGHRHIARLLLERSQCHFTLSDRLGRTALSIALQGPHTDTAALLQAHAKARAL